MTTQKYDWVVTLVALVFYAVIEAAWITAMKPYYAASFARMQPGKSGRYDNLAAVLCYAVLFFVVYLFLVHPVAARQPPANDLWHDVGHAVALGLAIYGVYNLTNKATLAGYSWQVVAVDTTWGVSALVAVILVARYVSMRFR